MTQNSEIPDDNLNQALTWDTLLEKAGSVVRAGGNEGDTARSQVIARSYTINRARHRLKLHKNTIEKAVRDGHLDTFVDPEENLRIAAEQIEPLLSSAEHYEKIAGWERIKVRDIADALNMKTSNVRKRLRSAGLDGNRPQWQQIRGRWDLPTTLQAFRTQVQDNRDNRRKDRRRKKSEARELQRQQREAERQRRADLRAQLVASFPAWSELDRSHQMIMLHIGPPNSGKTHDALIRLGEAGSGWYLAPLRLLAWEIYDRLNQRGVPCNLLTGEEYIPVEGARITAATIEMFNPAQSGHCVVIDEAQMIADSDRGWAWTRAMMQCRAPEMHIIAPETARKLISSMAEAANIPMGSVDHERLTPIKVADHHWRLSELPPKTILVAFSRRMVLGLKTQLEDMGRDVSVIYGALPPEVRRKQAERFAGGETDICIATDAVGMGLNLPADHVCFYEVEKFDGREMRLLKPNEVQQIGGRAGRYGFSQAGEVGTTQKDTLRIIRSLFYQTPGQLRFARVAPSVNDLGLIPGNLAEKLREWSQLQSIPQELRSHVKTSDMNERIELAGMLTDSQIRQLGLANALQLVNAPTRKSTRDFWYDCAIAIIEQVPMPLPPAPPEEITNTEELDYAETCIACADNYMWLAHRSEFREFGEHFEIVRNERRSWSERIDEALLHQIQTVERRRSRHKF